LNIKGAEGYLGLTHPDLVSKACSTGVLCSDKPDVANQVCVKSLNGLSEAEMKAKCPLT